MDSSLDWPGLFHPRHHRRVGAVVTDHLKTNFSLANWKGRAFRFITVTIGYWVGLGFFTETTTWETFRTIASNPMQVGGLVLVWIAALSTTGNPKKPG